MGSRPATQVTTTRVFTCGKCTPNSGSATPRYSQVNRVLSVAIQVCANTTLRNALARRLVCSVMLCDSGPSAGLAVVLRSASMAPTIMPIRICASPRLKDFPKPCSSLPCLRSNSTKPVRNSSASLGSDSTNQLGSRLRELSIASASLPNSAGKPSLPCLSSASKFKIAIASKVTTTVATNATATTFADSRPKVATRSRCARLWMSSCTSSPEIRAASRCSLRISTISTKAVVNAMRSTRLIASGAGLEGIAEGFDMAQ